MEITKELKEKLLKAAGEDEVKAILGEGADDENVSRIWNEIRTHRDLEKLDDDELEAVNGGLSPGDLIRYFLEKRDFEKEGCAATVEHNSFCGSNDACVYWDVVYENDDEACLPGVKGHDWRITHHTHSKSSDAADCEIWICKRCGKKTFVF